MKYLNKITLLTSVIGGSIASLLGGYDFMLNSLIGLVLVDIATGILKAWYLKDISKEKAEKGFIRKSTMFLLLIGVVYFEPVLQSKIALREIFMFYLCVTEFISVLDNARIIGIIPESIVKYFRDIRDKGLEVFNGKSNRM